MKLHGLQPGAIVECQKLGRTFPARVTGIPAGGREVDVLPLKRNISYRRIAARQVRRLLAPAPAAGEQLDLGGLA